MKYQSGSTQTGGVPGMENLVTHAWNDEGAAVSISGPEVACGTKRKFNNPAAERMGRYRLTLRFDSGRVQHLATFTDKNLATIWFGGHSLSKK